MTKSHFVFLKCFGLEFIKPNATQELIVSPGELYFHFNFSSVKSIVEFDISPWHMPYMQSDIATSFRPKYYVLFTRVDEDSI